MASVKYFLLSGLFGFLEVAHAEVPSGLPLLLLFGLELSGGGHETSGDDGLALPPLVVQGRSWGRQPFVGADSRSHVECLGELSSGTGYFDNVLNSFCFCRITNSVLRRSIPWAFNVI